MTRDKLFKKYYKNPAHDYEITETLSYTDDTGRKPEVCFVYSGRNRGKSFEISTQLLADSWYDKKTFGYIRRNDATTYDIEQYFADKADFIKDMTDGTREGITKVKGKLKFYHTEVNENTGDIKRVIDEDAGYFFALSRQSAYKSLQYPDLYNLIYEEVLTDSLYLNAEPERLMNLYSTCRRNKEGFTMWLVSNTVSVVNPYSKAWSLNLTRNKAGEVHLSKLFLGAYDEKHHEKYLLIACHYLKDKDTLSKEDEKKNKSKRVKTSIASNKWDESRLYTTIDKSFIEPYKPLATAVFEYDDVLIQCDVIMQPTNLLEMYLEGADPDPQTMPIGYIQRKTTAPKKGTRLYTNNPERFGHMVTRGYKGLCRIDDIIEKIRHNGWFIGADNLTMNDFYNILMKLRSPF